MKTTTLASVPALMPENTLTAYSPKPQRQPKGIVKLMPPVPQPDEDTVRELNQLASMHPFCAFKKVRRYDTL